MSFRFETMLFQNDSNRNDMMGHWVTGGNDRSWVFFIESDMSVNFAYTTDGTTGTQVIVKWLWPHSPELSRWYHLAVVRDNTGSPEDYLRAYIDGVELTPGSPDLTDMSGVTIHDPDPGIITYGSGDPPGGNSWDGRLEESRIIKKVMYSGNFTPPAARFLRY